MKKVVLALGMFLFAFSVSADSLSEGHERLGRCVYAETETVPETSSTLALAAIGFACLGFASMALNRKA
jgi:hypothetical protein